MSRTTTLANAIADRSLFQATLGKRIREARLLQGWSMKELGEKLGISGQQLQKYETGVDMIPLHRLLRIASLCSWPLESFWDVAHQPAISLDHDDHAGVFQLVRAYKRIGNPAMKRKLLRLVQEVAESAALSPLYRTKNQKRGSVSFLPLLDE